MRSFDEADCVFELFTSAARGWDFRKMVMAFVGGVRFFFQHFRLSFYLFRTESIDFTISVPKKETQYLICLIKLKENKVCNIIFLDDIKNLFLVI